MSSKDVKVENIVRADTTLCSGIPPLGRVDADPQKRPSFQSLYNKIYTALGCAYCVFLLTVDNPHCYIAMDHQVCHIWQLVD